MFMNTNSVVFPAVLRTHIRLDPYHFVDRGPKPILWQQTRIQPTCIGHDEPRAASLPGRTEEMKMQDGHECIV
jgi:hypothetical protein